MSRTITIPESLPDVTAEIRTEVWKPVVGYEGLYEVSDNGHVRRVKEYRGHIGLLKAKTSREYLYVGLSKGNRVQYRRHHRMVAEAFIGPVPPGMVINHKDCNKRNNSVKNLEIVTPYQNSIHSRINHRQQSKYGPNDVKTVFGLRRSGMSNRKIAKLIGMSKSNVQSILSGNTWRWIA